MKKAYLSLALNIRLRQEHETIFEGTLSNPK